MCNGRELSEGNSRNVLFLLRKYRRLILTGFIAGLLIIVITFAISRNSEISQETSAKTVSSPVLSTPSMCRGIDSDMYTKTIDTSLPPETWSSTQTWQTYLKNQRNIRCSTTWNGIVEYKAVPDYTYSGFHFGEEIPYIKDEENENAVIWRIHNIRLHESWEESLIDHTTLVQSLVDAIPENEGAIIYFPEGRYVLNGSVTVRRSNMIFRGEGVNRTLIELLRIDKEDSTWGGVEFIGYGGGTCRGIVVQSAGRFSSALIATGELVESLEAGDIVKIQLVYTGDTDLYKEDYFPSSRPFSSTNEAWTSQFDVNEVHEIVSIEAVNVSSETYRITFREPLLTDLYMSTEYHWCVVRVSPIQYVGVEDVEFQGAWNGELVHSEGIGNTWSIGVYFRNVRNGWIIRSRFRDFSVGLLVYTCSAFSVLDIEVVDNETSFIPLHPKNSGETDDNATGHHSLYVAKSTGVLVDCFVQNTYYFHGPSIGHESTGVVFRNIKMLPHQSLDLHSQGPYSNLVEIVDGGLFTGNGGAYQRYPNHLKHLVFWNWRQAVGFGEPYDFWSVQERNFHTLLDPTLVGVRSKDNSTIEYKKDSVLLAEEMDALPDMDSLYSAQLALRGIDICTAIKGSV